jgi:hypothetical protein
VIPHPWSRDASEETDVSVASLRTAIAVTALAASACGGGTSGGTGVTSDASADDHDGCVPLAAFENGDVANAPVEDVLFPWDRVDPVVLDGFDFGQVISGGPPPDGIRPIDDPCFDDVATADRWLEPQSPVMVVEIGDDRRAYPLAIMTQHEIVNEVVGGRPLVVTYCPLCNSGLAFERTVDGAVLDFGTSGRLFQANLIMYDRQTKTLWTQFTGRAVVGADHVGTELERIPTSLLAWEDFRTAAPDGVVLSPESEPDRDYGRNPYTGYEDSGDQFLFEGDRDDRLPPNTRVVGLGTDRDPVAIALDHLREELVVDLEVDGRPVTVWWSPGQASALDRATVDGGRDVGSTVAFSPVLDADTTLTFIPRDQSTGTFRDEQTGSTWNLLGEAIDGELTGTRLDAVSRDDTFWFVWFAFQPDTAVVGAGAAGV